jgi:DHA1 family bicyclomycin/chloramphenicol resistance-like MFS transporter
LPRTAPSLITLTLLTALSALTLNMILPSLPAISRELSARESVASLVVSGYMLASALFQLTLGPVSDRIGRRPVMLAALAVYATASLGCLLAPDIGTLLVCRVLQGVIVAGTVVSSAVVRDRYGARESAAKLGAIASAMAVAPMLGPLLGGWLDGVLGWRAVFALYAALGLVLLAVAWVDMGETRRPGLPPPRLADWATLLGSGRYWAYVLCAAFSVGAFFVFVTGVPYVATAQWALTPARVGLGVGSITGGFLLGAVLTTRLTPRHGIARLIVAGRMSALVGPVAGMLLFAGGVSHPLALFGATLFVGLGNGLTLSCANAGALSVRPDLAGTAAGLSGALSIALGALLSALTAMAIERSATPPLLLGLMLTCVLLSCLAAWVAVRLDRHG